MLVNSTTEKSGRRRSLGYKVKRNVPTLRNHCSIKLGEISNALMDPHNKVYFTDCDLSSHFNCHVQKTQKVS